MANSLESLVARQKPEVVAAARRKAKKELETIRQRERQHPQE